MIILAALSFRWLNTSAAFFIDGLSEVGGDGRRDQGGEGRQDSHHEDVHELQLVTLISESGVAQVGEKEGDRDDGDDGEGKGGDVKALLLLVMSCDGKAADSEEEKRIQKVNNKEASNIQAIKSFRKALPDASMEHLYCKSKVKETFLHMDQAHSQGVRSMMTLWLRHRWCTLDSFWIGALL